MEKKSEVVGFLTGLVEKESVRGDYKELVKLSLVYLGGPKVKLVRPGALHSARWMAKILYSIKMVLMSDKIKEELPKNIVFTADQLHKLKIFVNFCVLVYVQWWMTAPVASDAPQNDLKLMENIYKFGDIDETTAKVGTKALSSHLWYVTQELVPLAFFSSNVSSEKKKKMADTLSL